MFGVVGKAIRILDREGIVGVVNRIRYRRDNRLLQAREALPKQSFELVGRGNIFEAFRVSLIRWNLMPRSSHPRVCRKIIFNPRPFELWDAEVAAVVLDDDYLSTIRPKDNELLAGLTSGCPLIVNSGSGLRIVQGFGVSPKDVFLIPSQGESRKIQLAISRWLAFQGALAPELYVAELLDSIPPICNRDCVCLSLPEYIRRREGFMSTNRSSFLLFDGIRLMPAWKGCAWSYKTIAMKALQSQTKRLTICEDDAIFTGDFPERFRAIHNYLDQVQWDVFNGVMTRIAGEADIRMRRMLGKSHIVHTSHMMGMVFNIYNQTALEWMANWDPDAGGPEVNTIDEWMNVMPGLKVVSAIPFIAGHREDVESTIFGFRNKRYSGMIRATERQLTQIVERGS